MQGSSDVVTSTAAPRSCVRLDLARDEDSVSTPIVARYEEHGEGGAGHSAAPIAANVDLDVGVVGCRLW